MKEIKVLGFSGKKQSGKNTAANYVIGIFLKAMKITEDFRINDKGQLIVTDILGNKEYEGIFDVYSRHPNFLQFVQEEGIFSLIRPYSYADLLKQNVCIDILGLTEKQCYGSDEDKNSETHLRWEDMPGVITSTQASKLDNNLYESDYNEMGLITKSNGPMTARDVMQYVGTNIFRKMYSKVWYDGTIRKIKKDRPSMGIITDVRFPDELEIKDIDKNDDYPMSGLVLRFTRDPYKGQDQHESETALDNYDWDHPNLKVIDNKNMTIEEQNQEVHKILEERQWIPYEVPDEVLDELEKIIK